MRIRFFGDSWSHTWFHSENRSRFKNILSLDKTRFDAGFSLVQMLFDASGHEFTIHNKPGTGPLHTKEVIKETLSNLSGNEEEYWIWQMSCTLRDDTYDSFDFSNIGKFIDSYDARTLEHIQEVNDFGIPDHIHICLMGAHTSLPKTIFNSIENKSNNLHFMCRSFIEQVCTAEYGLTFNQYNDNHLARRLRLSSTKFIDDYVKPYGEDYMDYFGLDVLEFFAECADYGNHIVNDVVTWPDPGHLGFTGHMLLFEYVLNYIKELQARHA